MKNPNTNSHQVLLASRKTDARRGRRSNYGATTFAGVLLLLFLAPVGVAQTPQPSPDPLTITPQGNVGIGTTAPANKLSVAGSADMSGNLSVSGAVGIGTNTLGTSRFRLANPTSLSDFAHFRFDSAGGGEFEFVSWANGWNINSKMTGKNLYLNRDTSSDVWIGPFGKEMIVRGDTGNVGIGTNPQLGKLQIAGGATPALRLDANAGVPALSIGGTGELLVDAPGITGGRFIVKDNGNVGIGNAAPTRGKLEVIGWQNATFGQVTILRNNDSPTIRIPSDTNMTSIYADYGVAASSFWAFSDERLKRIKGRSDAVGDLATLMDIEITDYSYVDSFRGGRTQKKVTGQQVEKVFPQAVFKITDVVPDIYQKATMKGGWVTLATSLKKGERVRLIGEKQEGIHEVLEVAEGKFRTAFTAQDGPVFVYGREVNDARSVDYEAISMLNVSATQQIKKEKDEEVKALREENAALRTQLASQEQRLSELEAKDKARDERLAALEALLLAGDRHAPRAATLKKVE